VQYDDTLAKILAGSKPIVLPDLSTLLPKCSASSPIFDGISKGRANTPKNKDNEWRPISFEQDDDPLARILGKKKPIDLRDLSPSLPTDTVTSAAAEASNGAVITHKNDDRSLTSLIIAVAIGIAGALYYAAKPSKNEPERPTPKKVDPAP